MPAEITYKSQRARHGFKSPLLPQEIYRPSKSTAEALDIVWARTIHLQIFCEGKKEVGV